MQKETEKKESATRKKSLRERGEGHSRKKGKRMGAALEAKEGRKEFSDSSS